MISDILVTVIFLTSLLFVQPTQLAISDTKLDQIAGVISAEVINTDVAFYGGMCTIKSRLDSGWTIDTVLQHYNAQYVKPTKAQVAIAKNILFRKQNNCMGEYFVYSLQDISYLFKNYDALYTLCESPNKCNVFMSTEQFRGATRW